MALELTRRRLLSAAAALPLAGCARSEGRPNLLFIFPDQLRGSALDELAVHGLSTPAIDELRATSAVFPRAYCSNPLCTPSRSTLLTGLYPSTTGVTGVKTPLPLIFPTISECLADAGYRTGFIGKWHLEGDALHVPPGPERRGFQEWVAFNRNNHDYTSSTYYLDSSTALHPDPPDRYEPYYQTDFVLDFLERNQEGPFFLMVGFQPPHPPRTGQVPLGEWEGYVPEELLAGVDPEQILLRSNVPASSAELARRFLAGYYAAILSIDLCLARILGGLQELGLSEDTIVVFTSDHGELGGSHEDFGKDAPWEESTRVPLMLRWPGRIPPGVRRALANGADLAPTLLALTGCPPLGSHGSNLSEVLFDAAAEAPRPVYSQCRLGTDEEWHRVRTDRYAYWKRADGSEEGLYDLEEDPQEQEDLSANPAYAHVLAEHQGELVLWRERTAAS